MALSDYKFCSENAEVKAVENGESWLVLVDGKIACEMAAGGCHRFGSQLKAEVFGRQLTRGYSGGTFLSDDVENFIIEAAH